MRAGRQDGPALSLGRWNQRSIKEKAPAAGGRGKVVGVTGVTVTDRMLIDAGLSRQHRDSRNSIAVTFLQKSRTSFFDASFWRMPSSPPRASQRSHVSARHRQAHRNHLRSTDRMGGSLRRALELVVPRKAGAYSTRVPSSQYRSSCGPHLQPCRISG